MNKKFPSCAASNLTQIPRLSKISHIGFRVFLTDPQPKDSITIPDNIAIKTTVCFNQLCHKIYIKYYLKLNEVFINTAINMWAHLLAIAARYYFICFYRKQVEFLLLIVQHHLFKDWNALIFINLLIEK